MDGGDLGDNFAGGMEEFCRREEEGGRLWLESALARLLACLLPGV